MSGTPSASTQRPFGVRRALRATRVPRSSFYRAKQRREGGVVVQLRKRGPKTEHSDAELAKRIAEDFTASPFVGEGHRKAWPRLRAKSICVSRRRAPRVMPHDLLAPARPRRVLGPRVHDGRITTDAPDEMWGTDMTSTLTVEDGQVAVFIAVDRCTAECVGAHAARNANRFEALVPFRQGVRDCFGGFAKDIAESLSIRHDNGSQHLSRDFLGIESSPAFARAPEDNGVAERFIKTLKEQLLWVRAFRTLDELRLALHEFRRQYNEHRLGEKHGHRPPVQIRRRFRQPPSRPPGYTNEKSQKSDPLHGLFEPLVECLWRTAALPRDRLHSGPPRVVLAHRLGHEAYVAFPALLRVPCHFFEFLSF